MIGAVSGVPIGAQCELWLAKFLWFFISFYTFFHFWIIGDDLFDFWTTDGLSYV